MSMHPIMDKAEVAIDLPDHLYRGAFHRDSSFEVRVDAEELLLRLVSAGEERRIASVHLHHFVLADMLREAAVEIAENRPIDDVHREPLLDAARDLVKALRLKRPRKSS